MFWYTGTQHNMSLENSMSIKVLIFVGGEQIDSTDLPIIEMAEWSKPEAIALINAYKGDEWDSQLCDWLDGDVVMSDTIDIVSANIIQAGDDCIDGGMIYIVRQPN